MACGGTPEGCVEPVERFAQAGAAVKDPDMLDAGGKDDPPRGPIGKAAIGRSRAWRPVLRCHRHYPEPFVPQHAGFERAVDNEEIARTIGVTTGENSETAMVAVTAESCCA